MAIQIENSVVTLEHLNYSDDITISNSIADINNSNCSGHVTISASLVNINLSTINAELLNVSNNSVVNANITNL